MSHIYATNSRGVYNLRPMPTNLPIQQDVSLRDLNTFGLSATARAYLRIDNTTLLERAGSGGALRAMPLLVLGGGSNIVLTQNFDGLVLHMANRGIEVVAHGPEKIFVRAAAGESWHALVEWTLARGFGGLENLSLIPGSVGAAPIQNIGAYGLEVGALIDSVRYYDVHAGRYVTLGRAACEFGYRDSIFKRGLQGTGLIVDVTFALPTNWRPNLDYAELRRELGLNAERKLGWTPSETPDACPVAPAPWPGVFANGSQSPDARAVSDAVIAIRKRKLPDPARLGSAGSFFKNPLVPAEQHARLRARWPELVAFFQPGGDVKLAAGWLIDQCGWKGRSLGAAGVYEKQALVLVNRGGATGREVMQLATAIQKDVLAKFEVRLEAEPVVV